MRRSLVMLFFMLISASAQVYADDPAYMQVVTGQTVEIKGDWSKDGVFRAEEMELLPQSRRPKLRGAVERVDSSRQAIMVFGQWVTITPSTQFLDVTDAPVQFSSLKPKDRVEVSCKIDSAGQWSARHIRTRGVKQSDKIKGTVTRTAYDGHVPDTVLIETLRVLVTEKTEVFRTLGGSTSAADEQDTTRDTTR